MTSYDGREELGQGVLIRLNPETGEVESIGLLFVSTHPPGREVVELPSIAGLVGTS